MPLQIQAAVCREPRQAPCIETLTIGDPQPGEIRVAIRAVGICHTDMVLRDGLLPMPFPVVLGHEGSGVVAAIGEGVTSLVPGDHVVLSFDSCGRCPSCDVDQPAYCHSWFPLNFGGARSDGSTSLADEKGECVHSHIFGQSTFATQAIVRERNAIKVDKDLPLELLGPLGCGIQTGAGTILNVLRPAPGASIAVIGAGAVGMSATMAAKITQAGAVVALDLNPDRVAMALELGATHAFHAGSATMQEHAISAECPAGFDYIIDTTGIPEVVSSAIPALAPRGQMAMVAAYAPQNVEADATFIMSGGRVIRGVVEGGADARRCPRGLGGSWIPSSRRGAVRHRRRKSRSRFRHPITHHRQS